MPLNPQSSLFPSSGTLQSGFRSTVPDSAPRLWLLFKTTITPGTPTSWGDAITRASLVTGNEANAPSTWNGADAVVLRPHAGWIILLPVHDPLAADTLMDDLRQGLNGAGYSNDMIASCFLSDIGTLPPSLSCDYALTDRFQSLIIALRKDSAATAAAKTFMAKLPPECYSSIDMPIAAGDTAWILWKMLSADIINRRRHPLITFLFMSEDYDYTTTRLRTVLGSPNNTLALFECVEFNL